jgi:ABC-type transport system involved in multi-copper enzyme maturation permease subunit
MLVVGLIIFACFHVRHSFESREIDVFLSRPITRGNLVISYWIGFANVAFFHVLATVILLGIQGFSDWSGFLLWSISLLFECWIAVAIALFAAFTLRSAVVAILTSVGLYILGRVIVYFILTAKAGFMFDNQIVNYILLYAIKGTSVIMPRLDFFAKDEWLVSGMVNLQELWLVIIQTAIFVPLLICATIADFRRKQF